MIASRRTATAVKRASSRNRELYRTIFSRPLVREVPPPPGRRWFLEEKIRGGRKDAENRCPGSSRQLEHPQRKSGVARRRGPRDQNIPTNWLHPRHVVRARPTAIGNWDTWKRLARSEGGISRFSVRWLMERRSFSSERTAPGLHRFSQIDKPVGDRSLFESARNSAGRLPFCTSFPFTFLCLWPTHYRRKFNCDCYCLSGDSSMVFDSVFQTVVPKYYCRSPL